MIHSLDLKRRLRAMFGVEISCCFCGKDSVWKVFPKVSQKFPGGSVLNRPVSVVSSWFRTAKCPNWLCYFYLYLWTRHILRYLIYRLAASSNLSCSMAIWLSFVSSPELPQFVLSFFSIGSKRKGKAFLDLLCQSPIMFELFSNHVSYFLDNCCPSDILIHT